MPVAGDGEPTVPDARGPSPGAPKGNRNALKHGRYTAKALDRKSIAALLRTSRGLNRFDGEKTSLGVDSKPPSQIPASRRWVTPSPPTCQWVKY
jgi:hypothetical protein